MDVTRQTYEEIAEKYANDTRLQGLKLEHNLKRFSRELGDKGVVLDAGIGPGRDAKWLRDRGFSVFGLDYTFNMLKQHDITSVQADVRHIPFADECFDGITCHAVIHHVPPNQWGQVSEQFWRVLKPGGFLHIMTRYGGGLVWDDTYGKIREFWLMDQWKMFAAFGRFDIYGLRKDEQDLCVPGIKTDWLTALLRKE